jgi:hypothetical protein
MMRGLGLGVLRAGYVGHTRDGTQGEARGWCKSGGLEVVRCDIRCKGKSRGRQGGEPGAGGRIITHPLSHASHQMETNYPLQCKPQCPAKTERYHAPSHASSQITISAQTIQSDSDPTPGTTSISPVNTACTAEDDIYIQNSMLYLTVRTPYHPFSSSCHHHPLRKSGLLPP